MLQEHIKVVKMMYNKFDEMLNEGNAALNIRF